MTTKPKSKTPYGLRKTLHGKAWTQWSIYVRASNADWRGHAHCISCGKQEHWKLLHAGHFHHSILDFEPLNINPQCAGCNTYRHGNLGQYAHALIRKHGPKILDKLLEKKKNYKPYTFTELQQILNKYSKLNKQNGYT